MIMNKINLVLFFWVIHKIFFKIQMYNYLCIFFCAVPQPTVPPSAPDEALPTAAPGENNFIGEGLIFCLVVACLYFIFFFCVNLNCPLLFSLLGTFRFQDEDENEYEI